MTTPAELLAETTRAQQTAANPAWSAFVAANAGSGKTRVLTNRVARLLLAETAPSKILCITYTKAAAAEMADRLFKLLGEWALADDDKLREALRELEGEDAPARDQEGLRRARRLFARALETPGGLKIQTIHSFCESVLKRFPLEAGVAPGFTVIDETDAFALVNAAIDATALRAGNDAALGRAFDTLSAKLPSDAMRSVIADALLKRAPFQSALDEPDGWERLRLDAAEALEVAIDADAREIRAAAMNDLSDNDLARAYEALIASGKRAQGCAAYVRLYLAAGDDEEKWRALTQLFMTGSGAPRQAIADKETDRIDPSVRLFLDEAQEKFVTALDESRAADAFLRTEAYFQILQTAFDVYHTLKAARAALDYDDLISATRRLFADESAAWVMFKLDQGLDHILLDEAQDTSPAQWRVIEAPLDEFFAGENARATNRTFFAVGDQKQSIYRFQGADAGLFKEKQMDLGERIAAAAAHRSVPMTLSFRTVEPVLSFVDALFADKAVLEGVSSQEPLTHDIHRAGAAGLVELWPLTPRPEKQETRPWDAPVDASDTETAVAALSKEVARKIAGWLNTGEKLTSHDRPIRPGDIMILVQSRGPLFHAVNRALSQAGLPVAGADKLSLLEDPAVEDVLSYARAALSPEDDLSLAELLKSPFFNLDDDALFEIARDRNGSSLWSTLCARAGEEAAWRRAVAEISAARRIALGEGALSFFSHILEGGAPSGRRRLFARLGETSREPLEEFMRQALDVENASPRSLQTFLAWAEKNAGEISRDLDQTSEAIRVMTVHKAKGLEANIVFLLDGHRLPGGGRRAAPPLLTLKRGPRDAPVLAANAVEDASRLAAAREEEKSLEQQEYRRLLYVAATRARDRLYICGLESGTNKNPHKKSAPAKSWHALSEDAFERLDARAEEAGDLWGGKIRRLSSPQTSAFEKEDKTARAAPAGEGPDWLFQPAPAEQAPARLSPSHLADHLEAEDMTGEIDETTPYSPARPVDRFLRGRVLHRLLELLPDLAPGDRDRAADKLLARLAPEIDPGERGRWRREALAVIEHPDFSPAFGPESRAEVAVSGAPVKGGPIISGQIDRLAVTDERILLIDYKTNRPPPARVEDTPLAYLAQMAAYRALAAEIWPGRRIEAALLWTYEARLSVLPPALMDDAFKRAVAGQ